LLHITSYVEVFKSNFLCAFIECLHLYLLLQGQNVVKAVISTVDGLVALSANSGILFLF
jgi:hypothetical protein